MATLQDFENTLNEVVNARRLSASKMNKLTEIAMKSLEDDTKLVAILYRTHKSLPSTAKVSSLYAFDALARAARSAVNKRGITGDINSKKGNAATFLRKIEGVLDGLFQDMVSLSTTEAKEKTKKVLEIWVKSNTFPSAVLARLGDILSDVRKAIFAGILASNEMRVSTETQFGLLFPSENTLNSTPVDPRVANEAPTIIIPPQPATDTPTTAPDVQATLLALLGQAAQITSQNQTPTIQTPPNTDPQLGPNQLALLQQLALKAKLTNGTPAPPPGQASSAALMNANGAPAVAPLLGASYLHSGAPPPVAVSRFDPPGDPRYGRNGYADRPRDRPDYRDDRPPRGGFRGGFRGRGRWDDRSRPRDRDWDPPSRQRHSRSRSPRGHEERRNMRPYSPPRRPSTERDSHLQSAPTPPTQTNDKDEFGRDITGRPSSLSPSRSMSVEDTHALAPMDPSVVPAPTTAPDYHIPVSDQLPLVAASTSAENTETHTPSSASQRQPGLDQFDVTTFEATAPSSWEALGNMWQTAHGYPPSQEELMQFVIARSMAATGMANEAFGGVEGGQWQQGSWEEQGPRRNGGWRGRGRGNYTGGGHGGHGNYRNGGGYANAMEAESSYTVALDGDVDETNGSADANNHSMARNHPNGEGGDHGSTPNTGTTGGGPGGRMQRVGDKWVFVKNAESGAS